MNFDGAAIINEQKIESIGKIQKSSVEIRNPSNSKQSSAAVNEAILARGPFKTIKHLWLHEESCLEDLKLLASFPRLQGFWIQGKRLKDFADLSAVDDLSELYIDIPKRKSVINADLSAKKIEALSIAGTLAEDAQWAASIGSIAYLTLTAWSSESLKGLETLKCRGITIKGTRLTSSTGAPEFEQMTCAGCRHLVDMSSVQTQVLTVDTCHRMDFGSLEHSGIRVINIRNCRQLQDFSFLSNQAELEELTVTALNTGKPNFTFKKIFALKRIFISGTKATPDALIRLSEVQTSAVVTNGFAKFVNGKQIAPPRTSIRVRQTTPGR